MNKRIFTKNPQWRIPKAVWTFSKKTHPYWGQDTLIGYLLSLDQLLIRKWNSNIENIQKVRFWRDGSGKERRWPGGIISWSGGQLDRGETKAVTSLILWLQFGRTRTCTRNRRRNWKPKSSWFDPKLEPKKCGKRSTLGRLLEGWRLDDNLSLSITFLNFFSY